MSSYRTREVRLAFGGDISGEQGACAAVVWSVAPELEAVTIKLLSDNGEQWYRAIPLEKAAFFFAEEDDPAFHVLAGTQFSAVLIITFPDGTTLFLAESAPSGSL